MTPVLRLSIGANVVLLGVVALLLWRGRPAAPASAVPAAPATPPDAAHAEIPPSRTTPPDLPRPGTSGQLNATAIDQLEQMGIAREVLVNVVLGHFHRRWDERFAELERRHAPRQVPEREYVELARLREADQLRELKETLGEQRYLAWDREQTLRLLNAGGVPLSPAEAEQAYRWQKEFEEEYRARQMAMEDGVADVADLGTLHQQAQETLDRQLEQLLGPARYRALRGIAEPIADVYRKFGDLNPTPDQAQAALQIETDHRAREAALARRLQENPADAAGLAAELQALQDAREEELRRTFGAEAYDAMKRQNDRTYQTLTQFAAAWELRQDEIQPVYESLRAFHDQAERTRTAAAMREAAGQRVDWHEVNASIEQARLQTEAGLQTLIGGSRLWRLKQNGILTMR